MKKLVYRDAIGAVVNIGEWDLCVLPVREGGKIIGESVTNPIPDGVTCAEEDVAERADGGLAAVTDHVSLRRSAYPSIADQLDAFWKGGIHVDEMRARVLDVKSRFPKAAK